MPSSSRPTGADIGALAALLLFVASRCLVPMDETDLFYNLRLGEIILERRAVPTTNLLSFTHPDAADPNLAWLFQVLLALIYRVGGVPGTVVLKTAFVLATWAVLYFVARVRGARPAVAAAVLALAAWAAEPRFVERPHLVTFLGLAVVLAALERVEAGRRPLWLWGLVPAGLVWANGNSCFFLAPATLLLYAAGAAIDRRRNDTHALPARTVAMVAVALVPLAFATPAGFDAARYVANHFRMPWLRPLQEYRTAAWPEDGPFFLLAAALAAMTPLLAARRRIAWRVLLPTAALCALGAVRIRFVAEFAIFAGPAVAAGLSTVFAPALDRSALRARILTASVVAALGLVAAGPRIAAAASGRSALELGLAAHLVPTEAIAFIERNGLAGRLYNDLEVGSYLAWRWWPRHRVFQDPRINGYPEPFHAILRRTDLDRRAWQSFLDSYGVDAALVTYPDLNPRAAWFDPDGWALVYRAPDGIVYARRGGRWRDLTARLELPLTFRYGAAEGTTAIALDEPPASATIPHCVWKRRLGQELVAMQDAAAARAAFKAALAQPGCLGAEDERGARRGLATAALRLGEFAEALEALAPLGDDAELEGDRGFARLGLSEVPAALAGFERAIARDASLVVAIFGRALALERLGRTAEARAAYERFLARAPNHVAAPEAWRRLRALGRPRDAGRAP